MEKLVDEGLARTIGISNYSVKKTKEVQSYARIQPAVNQVEIHPFFRNDALWEFATSTKVRFAASSLCFALHWVACMLQPGRSAPALELLSSSAVFSIRSSAGRGTVAHCSCSLQRPSPAGTSTCPADMGMGTGWWRSRGPCHLGMTVACSALHSFSIESSED